jgi:hypothetical protein
MKRIIHNTAKYLGIEEITPMMMIGLAILILMPFPTITLIALIIMLRRFIKK